MTWAAVLHLSTMPACTVPGMVPDFWPAVVRQESGYDALALHDDTASRAYYPATLDDSEALAIRLMTAGHSVGVGLSQLTARNPQQFWNKFGLTIRQALDACTNMHAGARHYVNGALSIYQSGNRETGISNGYAAGVTANIDRIEQGAVNEAAAPCPELDPTGWHVKAGQPGCQHDDWHISPTLKDVSR